MNERYTLTNVIDFLRGAEAKIRKVHHGRWAEYEARYYVKNLRGQVEERTVTGYCDVGCLVGAP